MTSAQDRPKRRRRRGRRPGAQPASQPAATADAHPVGSEPNSSVGQSGEPNTGRRDDAGHRVPPSHPDEAAHPDGTGHRDDAGRGHGRDSERGWRELAGSAPSQVGPGGALRARDVARPTAEDLAAAERTVVVVRRQWQPPEG
jgi:hypothetical protein